MPHLTLRPVYNLVASLHSQASMQPSCHGPLSDPCAPWLPRSTLRPMCNQAATIHSQTSVQLDCHAPLSDQWAIKQTRSTLRPVHNLIATFHSQTSGQSSWHSPLSRRLKLLHAHCGTAPAVAAADVVGVLLAQFHTQSRSFRLFGT